MRLIFPALAAVAVIGLSSCAPATSRTDAGPLAKLPAAPAGALVDSRLAFGLRYPDGTTTPGSSEDLDARLQGSLEGTRNTCIAGRTEHAVLLNADAFAEVDTRMRKIGYSITPITKNTYLISRDFDVLAAHADGNTLSMCETRW